MATPFYKQQYADLAAMTRAYQESGLLGPGEHIMRADEDEARRSVRLLVTDTPDNPSKTARYVYIGYDAAAPSGDKTVMAVRDQNGKVEWHDVNAMAPIETPPSPWGKGKRRKGRRVKATPSSGLKDFRGLTADLVYLDEDGYVDPDTRDDVAPYPMLAELNDRFRPPFNTVRTEDTFYLDGMLTVYLHLGGEHVQTVVLDVSSSDWKVLHVGKPE